MFKIGDFVYYKNSDNYYFGKIVDINPSYTSQYEIQPLYNVDGISIKLDNFYTNQVEDGHKELEKRMLILMDKLALYKRIDSKPFNETLNFEDTITGDA